MKKMKAKTPQKSVRNAHILLAAYWVYKMLNGGNILKTTLSVLQMENSSVMKERKREGIKEQEDPKGGRAKAGRTANMVGAVNAIRAANANNSPKAKKSAGAKAPAKTKKAAVADKTAASGAGVPITQNVFFWSVIIKILKSARVF